MTAVLEHPVPKNYTRGLIHTIARRYKVKIQGQDDDSIVPSAINRDHQLRGKERDSYTECVYSWARMAQDRHRRPPSPCVDAIFAICWVGGAPVIRPSDQPRPDLQRGCLRVLLAAARIVLAVRLEDRRRPT